MSRRLQSSILILERRREERKDGRVEIASGTAKTLQSLLPMWEKNTFFPLTPSLIHCNNAQLVQKIRRMFVSLLRQMLDMTCHNKSVSNKSLFNYKGYNTDMVVMLSFT